MPTLPALVMRIRSASAVISYQTIERVVPTKLAQIPAPVDSKYNEATLEFDTLKTRSVPLIKLLVNVVPMLTFPDEPIRIRSAFDVPNHIGVAVTFLIYVSDDVVAIS